MLIVGEGGAGKTTLAHKINNSDCRLPKIDDRTRGITIQMHEFQLLDKEKGTERTFRLNVWDFGGQEIYHYTHRFFLSRRSLYVLVADNRKDNTDFNYWLYVIGMFAGNSPIVIVLNEKDDLQRVINQTDIKAQFPDSIKEIAAVNFKTAEETNLEKRKQRLKSIDKLRGNIEGYVAFLPHVGEPVPAKWIHVREKLESDNRNHISFNEFEHICHDNQINESQDIDVLLGYFHDLGIVLHYKDNPALYNYVILKPAWATCAVYRIFDDDGIKAKKGRFTANDCEKLWSDPQYDRMLPALIALMKNFNLVYEIGCTGNLVAPQLLPNNTPDYQWDEGKPSCKMQLRFDLFMPKGILWQFIVSMYKYIDDHGWVWQNGVILQRNSTKAEVIENNFDRRIYIRFSGPGIPEFRAIIADRLDEISSTFQNLKYDKYLPCNCEKCMLLPEPYLFKFSRLIERKEKGKLTIECDKSYIDVPVIPLLEGFINRNPFENDSFKFNSNTQITQTFKIFLASSSELESDRDKFEIFINRENKHYIKKGIFLDLIRWEDFIDCMSPTRLQVEYNKAVRDCDILVSLFHSKVGKFTEEEFDTAFGQFKETSRPLIYTYFSNESIKANRITEDINTLLNFKKKLKSLGHFQTEYENIDDLKHQFSNQLRKILPRLTGINPFAV